jgi:hypothetical protein
MSEFIRELGYIKRAQREFEQLFGKKLVVDIAATKGIEPVDDDLQRTLEACLKWYNADIEKMRRGDYSKDAPENIALRAFCCKVIENKWNQVQAAKLINRDRGTLRYHGGYNLVRKKRREIQHGKLQRTPRKVAQQST